MTNTPILQTSPTHALNARDRERTPSEHLHIRPGLLALLAAAVLSALGCADTHPGVQSEASPSDGESLLDDEEVASPPVTGGLRSKHPIIAEAKLPGRTIQFIEPEPGMLIELETGNAAEVSQASEPDSDDVELSSVERYERLTGRAAPEKLLRAQELVDEVRLRVDAAGGRSSNVERPQAHSPEQLEGNKAKYGPSSVGRQWFLDNYCKPTNRYQFWFGAGGFETSLVKEDVNFLRTGVYSILGSVDFYVVYGGTVFNNEKLDVLVGEGQYAAVHAWSQLNAVFGSSAGFVSGPLYDHCINYHF